MAQWEVILEKNQHSHASGAGGFDKIPAVDAYFSNANGEISIVTKTYWTEDDTNSELFTFVTYPFDGVAFDFSKYKYKVDIYSYYLGGYGASDTNHLETPHPYSRTVTAEFYSIEDLNGVRVSTDIKTVNASPGFIKYHIILSRAAKEKVSVKINGNIKNVVAAYTKINGQIKRATKLIYYKRAPFSIPDSLGVPFLTPSVDFRYQKYGDVINRFAGTKTEVYGRDASNTYDLVCVHIGTVGKPCIIIDACMHGPEWQTTQYTTGFALDLINNTFPDPSLRDNLLKNYHLLVIPCYNPWGMNNFGKVYDSSRHNANNIDLNRDFAEGVQSQAETRAYIGLFRKYKPFASLDAHTFGAGYEQAEGNYIIVGNGHDTQNDIKAAIANTMQLFTGDKVTEWGPVNAPTNQLLRAFVAREDNPYNFHTLSYITEIERPKYPRESNTDGDSRYTNSEIYKIGYLLNYLFLKTSIMYFEHYQYGKKVEHYF